MEGDNSERMHKLKIQLEYYLSDENLKRDRFFHEKISADENVLYHIILGLVRS